MSLKLNKYLSQLKNKALKFEKTDINGKEETNWFKRNTRCISSAVISIFSIWALRSGFNSEFINYTVTSLSIFIGLFTTAIIFSLDKITGNESKERIEKEIITKENSKKDKKTRVSISNIPIRDSQIDLLNLRISNYYKQFSYITGYNIVLCIYTIILLSFSVLGSDYFNIDVSKLSFSIKNIDIDLTIQFIINIIQRFLVVYYIVTILYNTLYVISSLASTIETKKK